VAIKKIDAKLLQKAFIAGAYNLERNKEYINELNVFPVPDGDTGSNMSLTIMAAAKEVAALVDPTIEELAKTISSGSLRGARGNSGVILSQLLRGFCREIRDKKAITTTVLADGFVRGVETAYKAVMKPKEGTILTVAKGVAEKAVEMADMRVTVEEFAEAVIEHGNIVLDQTPEMLPVLKEAGVVDSGGQGLMEFLKGAYNGLIGKETIEVTAPTGVAKQTISSEDIDTSHITFGYCTEFIIMLEKEYNMDIEEKFKEYLTSIGDSLVVVSDDEIVKVHVHTNHPGLAFEKGLEFGQLTNMKVDNMREEHREKVIMEQDRKAAADKENEAKKAEPQKEYGFVAVSVGEGLDQIFTELGADHIIQGGQTMNPSTDDVLSAIEKVNAKNVYVLPNNKNIILAANQAASIEKEKNVIVIPSKTIPQGINALICFDPEGSTEDNKEAMTEGLSAVKSGQVTYAVRDTSIDGKEIKTGDYMGIDDGGIKAVGTDIKEVVIELVKEMKDDSSELLSVYYGSDVSEEDATSMEELLKEKYPDLEVELHTGNQPIYYYIVSVE